MTMDENIYNILIVDDNRDMQFILSNILRDEGYRVTVAGTGSKAIQVVQQDTPDLVLLDIRLPGVDGIQVLGKIKEIYKDVVVIMLTAYGDIKGAVNAMKLGAYDYITKPFNNDDLILVIKRALEMRHLTKEVRCLKKKLGEKSAADIIEALGGESPEIKRVMEYVDIVSPTNVSVVLQGGSGTGKELVAHLIHKKSARCENTFLAVDCGAIPNTLIESELFGYEKGAFTGADKKREGKFEQADDGTLFLDEITNLSESAQAKLLRVIQEKKVQHLGGGKDIEVDVRIIAATNIDLIKSVRHGEFREDLFYRLNEFQIVIPLLRERKEDIPVLAQRFLGEANGEFGKNIKGFSPEVMKSFLDYYWPGNVRELKNTVKRAVLLADKKYIEHVQFLLNDDLMNDKFEPQKNFENSTALRDAARNTAEKIEKDMIIKTLEKTAGNKSKASRILEIDRGTLYNKLKKFGIE